MLSFQLRPESEGERPDEAHSNKTTEPKQAVQMVAEERLLDLAGKSFA